MQIGGRTVLRLTRVFLVTLLGVTLLASCGDDDDGAESGASATTGSEGGGEVIRVGTSVDLSGPATSTCKPMSEAERAWIDHVNSEGGINGRQIEYTALDDGNDSTRALANVRELADDPSFLAVFGTCATSPAAAITEFAEENEVPFVMPFGATESVITPHKEWVHGTFPPYDLQTGQLVRWAFEEHGPGSVMSLTFTTSTLWDAEVVDVVESGGGEFLENITFTVGQPSFGSEVLRLNEADPDYIIFSGSLADVIGFVQEMERQDYRPKKLVLGIPTWADPTVAKTVKSPFLDELYVAPTAFVLNTDPGVETCAEVLGVEPEDMNLYSLFGCSAGQVLTSAIERLGDDVSRESLQQLLASEKFNVEIPGLISGNASYSPDGLMTHTLRLTTVVDGELVYVEGVDAIEVPPYKG